MSNIQDQIKSIETSLAAMKHHAAGGAIQYKVIKQPMDREWNWCDYSSTYFDLSLYEYRIKEIDPLIEVKKIISAAIDGKTIEWNESQKGWQTVDIFQKAEMNNLLRYPQYYRIKP